MYACTLTSGCSYQSHKYRCGHTYIHQCLCSYFTKVMWGTDMHNYVCMYINFKLFLTTVMNTHAYKTYIHTYVCIFNQVMWDTDMHNYVCMYINFRLFLTTVMNTHAYKHTYTCVHQYLNFDLTKKCEVLTCSEVCLGLIFQKQTSHSRQSEDFDEYLKRTFIFFCESTCRVLSLKN
jgi:hypothetical protein